MVVSIMQPYFLPYLGYWQLINASSVFILFDDVNYIKKGFIDRNTIFFKQELKKVKIRIVNASQNRAINQHEILESPAELMPIIERAYSEYEQYQVVLPILRAVLEYPERNLALFVENSIKTLCLYFGIHTRIERSSSFSISASGKERIIPLVKGVGGSTYLNMEGGRFMYDKSEFSEAGLDLSFFQPELPGRVFRIPHSNQPTSIIDLMMRFDSKSLGRLISLGEVARA